MKKVLAIVVIGAVLAVTASGPAHAGGAAAAALALGAFAVFNGLFLAPVWAAAYATPAPIVYAAPYVYAAPVYVAPRATSYYGPPASAPAASRYTQVPPPDSAPAASAPAASTFSREVVYAHGRYMLVGDGLTTPFKWAWIPNPPPPPPAPGS